MIQNVVQVCGCFIQYIIFKVVVGRLTLIRSGILDLHTIYIYIYINTSYRAMSLTKTHKYVYIAYLYVPKSFHDELISIYN